MGAQTQIASSSIKGAKKVNHLKCEACGEAQAVVCKKCESILCIACAREHLKELGEGFDEVPENFSVMGEIK